MTVLSRRRFLAASAASAAFAGAPVPAVPAPGDYDVAIIGGGAAGIAAARRLAGSRAKIVVIEASDHVGGRCITDRTTFGTPFDRGAQWLTAADVNPVVPLATQSGLDMYPASPSQRVRIGRRYARTGELEEYLTTSVRANRAVTEAGRRQDISAAQVMPKELGDWRPTIEFALGPFTYASDLSELSTLDLARSAGRDNSMCCRQGLGTLLTRLADGLPVQLSNPVSKIDYSERNRVEIKTAKGYLYARTAIVTVSTGVLTAGKLTFDPELPKHHQEALDKLRLGSRDRIALELPGNPLGLGQDELVFEKAQSNHTAAIVANIHGSNLCSVEIGGKLGADLTGAGQAAMEAFALDWLTGLYGADLRKSVRRISVTRWNYDPWALGASSVAAPGGQWARAALAEPVRDRVFFAGEATHETLWGTVGGAWASGERAADGVMKKLGLAAEASEPRRSSSRTSRRR